MMRSLLAKNPKQGEVWFLLGYEYAAQKQKSEAIKAYSEALKYCDEETKLKIAAELLKIASIADSEDSTGAAEATSFTGVVNTADATNLVDITNSTATRNSTDIRNSTDTTKPTDITASAERTYPDSDNSNPAAEEKSSSPSSKVIPFQVLAGGKQQDEPDAPAPVTFKDVGGLTEIKDTIRMKIIEPFLRPGLFQHFKKKVGGGILLYGPPGCGKTYLAKATAGECQAYFKSVHITDILSKYIGDSEKNIKSIFDTARAHRPCILFFDEIDSIGFNRARLSSEHFRPVIDQFLMEIEGIDSNTDNILIIGATNMPWDVDPAFKRPGRFDKSLFIPPPDLEARAVIFQLKLSERPVDALDYVNLARRTELYSGADIENVVEVAAENVIAEIMETGSERNIGMKDLLSAIEKTQPSTLEWLRTIKNYVKYANQTGLYNDVEKYLERNKKSI